MAGDPRAISRLSGSAAEAQEIKREQLSERAKAENILTPEQMRSGNVPVNAGRLMMTMLGGEIRPMTPDDLNQFRQKARELGRRFQGGITARQVVDMSLSVDRQRAREQIRMAVPAAARGLKKGDAVTALEARFITDASGETKGVYRHHVTVEFTGYPEQVIAGEDTAQRAAAKMRKQGIRFDCDCGRHRYWYRYVASVGGYNAGRPETGFPKIRNPNLVGVACKHVLRVMSEIEGGNAVQAFLARAIEKGRKNGDGAGHIRQLQKEAERLADKQAKRPMASNARDSGDRDFDRARRALRRQSRATTTKPKRAAKGSRRAAALGATPSARDKLMAAAKELGISPDQAAAIFRAAAKDKP